MSSILIERVWKMNIYFVCTGNTCRSPMAEAILKSMNLENVQVKSAGIYALDGGEMSENAKSVLQSEKIYIEHQSSAVTLESLQWADLVLTMTVAHKSYILATFPQFKDKVYTLKEFTAPYSSQDISDPFGGNLQQYKQTYDELKYYIQQLQTKMKR